jgi:hypothetical protein
MMSNRDFALLADTIRACKQENPKMSVEMVAEVLATALEFNFRGFDRHEWLSQTIPRDYAADQLIAADNRKRGIS